MDAGPLPEGAANMSAQSCASCHYSVVEQWSQSAHSADHTAFFDLIDDMGMPACASCHLPLARQHPTTVQYVQGDASRPLARDNHGWDLTLRSEGVTCAACHLREGRIITGTASGRAPHEVLVSEELATSTGCAACHQLTLPGSDEPLYDTFGEWQRSTWGQAGVQCQDCHMASAADGGSDHAMPARTGHGLSVLVRTDAYELVRGGEPIDITLVLQNTGAGHSLPTGSPFVAWIVSAWMERTGEDGAATRHGEQSWRLARQLAETAPFATLSDTRLAANEERTLTWTPALDLSAEQGAWRVVVEVREQVGDTPSAIPLRSWRTPFIVR